ncbi:bifunctional 2-polyprenyl-6-hydroxyphenol methylase/3-demethylubiquinol 3-O-methyltransferase UbiG [Kordiimonas sp. SCSIO 12610]|uniref:class I SAM-dependent methyltransferase n=1 Tax=Kordiimonas sp. SCSIO 12610 TaxID=2829597 RepID=UPI00210E609E|nr:class I SAM-dependent methyltransferase [Kordiimonas sp. SCSIO 12610]UTW56074.1 class I SAM-dependent methyltransferase [Kordiimonas sp. SCSIO 12610]
MHDPETINVYDQQAARYSECVGSTDDYIGLDTFIGRLPAGGTVLDLGCGSGEVANRIHNAGFQVTAIDASKAMVELTRQYSGVHVYQATFDTLNDHEKYDGIWANFSLLHAKRPAFIQYIKRIHTALKPQGIFHIGMKNGVGEGRDHLGRFYTYYTIKDLKGLLQEAGFTIEAEHTGTGKGLAGTNDPWVVFTTSKDK